MTCDVCGTEFRPDRMSSAKRCSVKCQIAGIAARAKRSRDAAAARKKARTGDVSAASNATIQPVPATEYST